MRHSMSSKAELVITIPQTFTQWTQFIQLCLYLWNNGIISQFNILKYITTKNTNDDTINKIFGCDIHQSLIFKSTLQQWLTLENLNINIMPVNVGCAAFVLQESTLAYFHRETYHTNVFKLYFNVTDDGTFNVKKIQECKHMFLRNNNNYRNRIHIELSEILYSWICHQTQE